MKYPQLVPMPSAVSDWLEEQLEARGIDALVYTRYILSLLHSDVVDVIYSDEDLHCSHLDKEVKRQSGGSRSNKRFRRSCDWWRHAEADAEKLKRSAAVECLMSASEQTFGIESLVDELCEKLNHVKQAGLVVANRDDVSPVAKATTGSSTDRQKSQPTDDASPQEKAERYYAAFPPLARNAAGSSSETKPIALVPKWIASPKKTALTGTNVRRTDGPMKATGRTIGKQCYGAYFAGRNNKDWQNRQDDWKTPKKPRSTLEQTVTTSSQVLSDDPPWNENDLMYYDDLPVDIKELLEEKEEEENESEGESCNTHSLTMESNKNSMANMKDSGGKKEFIHSGTNITSSIWSNNATDFDFDNNSTDLLGMGMRFSNINLEWGSPNPKLMWEYSGKGGSKWSDRDDGGCLSVETSSNVSASLSALNHDYGASAFAVVAPKNRVAKTLMDDEQAEEALAKTVDLCNDNNNDDLLTSINSHFRPIKDKVGVNYYNYHHHHQSSAAQYADGSTFAVSNHWDQISYTRSESGAFYLEADRDRRHRYCEYRPSAMRVDFVLKFLMCPNNKACQTTEDLDAEVARLSRRRLARCPNFFDDDDDDDSAEETDHSVTTGMTPCYCSLHQQQQQQQQQFVLDPTGPWKRQAAMIGHKGGDAVWSTDSLEEMKQESMWDDKLREIWKGDDVSDSSCLWRSSSTLEHDKLREDVSHDGDQLLSDLSTLQKCYQTEDEDYDDDDGDDYGNASLPAHEFTQDISELIIPKAERRKRRHSLMAATANHVAGGEGEEPWSFASRLEEDCLIQMSALPTLRSVTL